MAWALLVYIGCQVVEDLKNNESGFVRAFFVRTSETRKDTVQPEKP